MLSSSIRIFSLLIFAIFPHINGLKGLSEYEIGGQRKILYNFTNDPIDVIIPCSTKDLETLELCIEGIRKNCTAIRRVIVVSPEKLTEKAEWFDEKNYPFNKTDVALSLVGGDSNVAKRYLNSPRSRIGWYLQQLLKFYAPFVIPGISSNVLMLDSDTIFLRPVNFLNDDYGGLYNTSLEYHRPYFSHLSSLFAGKIKRFTPNYSGITHHMLFQRSALEELFHTVEKIHKTEFWKAFCSCVSKDQIYSSGASEYEIYFNFILSRTDQVSIRPLKFANISRLEEIPKCYTRGCSYVSCHRWMRDLVKQHSDTP